MRLGDGDIVLRPWEPRQVEAVRKKGEGRDAGEKVRKTLQRGERAELRHVEKRGKIPKPPATVCLQAAVYPASPPKRVWGRP